MPTATAASKTAAPKPVPVPNGDFYQLVDLLTPEERAVVKKVRTYMETKVQPIINKYWSDDAFPFELLPSFKELGIGGLGFEGYGCAGGSQKLFGFVAMELARTDASFCTFFGVHSGLAMGSIYLDGSEEQKQKWLPPMARWEKIGCFGLTEPLVGSGTSGGLTTTAKREGDTSRVLRMTRYMVGWASTGIQMGAYEATVKYAQERLQFGKPIASFQMIQDLLAKMLANLTACQCLMLRLAQLDDEGKLGDHHAALAKAFCTAKSRETVSWGREVLGGNGIVADYSVARFFADAEALYSYEGTYQMQNLIVGKAITGHGAFI